MATIKNVELPLDPKKFGPNLKRAHEFWSKLSEKQKQIEEKAWREAKESAHKKDLLETEETNKKKNPRREEEMAMG